MMKPLTVAACLFGVLSASAADQGSVQVEPALQGSRPLAKQTEAAVIRDYLEAWQSLSAAMEQNRAVLLTQDFVGNARDKFTATIDEQSKLGLSTRYQERSHDIQVTFYSPEGLSIQLVDNIEYDVQLLDHGKVQATEPVHARYVAVLTPAEVRWKVRVLQAEPQVK
jgi:hypothetical protein